MHASRSQANSAPLPVLHRWGAGKVAQFSLKSGAFQRYLITEAAILAQSYPMWSPSPNPTSATSMAYWGRLALGIGFYKDRNARSAHHLVTTHNKQAVQAVFVFACKPTIRYHRRCSVGPRPHLGRLACCPDQKCVYALRARDRSRKWRERAGWAWVGSALFWTGRHWARRLDPTVGVR